MERARPSWNICVINKAMLINPGDTSKDTEASVKGHSLLKSKWCWSPGSFPSPVDVCQCWVKGRLSLENPRPGVSFLLSPLRLQHKDIASIATVPS